LKKVGVNLVIALEEPEMSFESLRKSPCSFSVLHLRKVVQNAIADASARDNIWILTIHVADCNGTRDEKCSYDCPHVEK
jgi:hypothetical protein